MLVERRAVARSACRCRSLRCPRRPLAEITMTRRHDDATEPATPLCSSCARRRAGHEEHQEHKANQSRSLWCRIPGVLNSTNVGLAARRPAGPALGRTDDRKFTSTPSIHVLVNFGSPAPAAARSAAPPTPACHQKTHNYLLRALRALRARRAFVVSSCRRVVVSPCRPQANRDLNAA